MLCLRTYRAETAWSVPCINLLDNGRPGGAGVAAFAARDRLGNLPLHLACCSKAPPQVIRRLLAAYPEGVRARNAKGWLPLHLAAEPLTWETLAELAGPGLRPLKLRVGDEPGQLTTSVGLLLSAAPEAVESPVGAGPPPLDGGLPRLLKAVAEGDNYDAEVVLKELAAARDVLIAKRGAEYQLIMQADPCGPRQHDLAALAQAAEHIQRACCDIAGLGVAEFGLGGGARRGGDEEAPRRFCSRAQQCARRALLLLQNVFLPVATRLRAAEDIARQFEAEQPQPPPAAQENLAAPSGRRTPLPAHTKAARTVAQSLATALAGFAVAAALAPPQGSSPATREAAAEVARTVAPAEAIELLDQLLRLCSSQLLPRGGAEAHVGLAVENVTRAAGLPPAPPPPPAAAVATAVAAGFHAAVPGILPLISALVLGGSLEFTQAAALDNAGQGSRGAAARRLQGQLRPYLSLLSPSRPAATSSRKGCRRRTRRMRSGGSRAKTRTTKKLMS